MVSSDKPKDWIKVCTNALTDASTRFSSPGSVNAFSLFDSSPYCAKKSDGDSQDEQDDEDDMDYKWDMNWMKNKDLIFKDRSSSLVLIPEVKVLCFVPFTKGWVRHQIPTENLSGREKLETIGNGTKESLECIVGINKFYFSSLI